MHSHDDHALLPDPARQPEFYADVPVKRLLAWVFDILLVAVLCLLALPFTAFTGIFFFPFLMLVVGLIYRTLTIAGGSATWGMRLMSIELRDRRGERLDSGQALLHTIGYSVSIAFPLLQAISVVLMLTGERRQGLTDLVLGTVMLNRRA
ncbi:RDD family protein [Rhodosalinus halophilus]|uniref:RDD family protein n=1 Tax=Rhodosalinus halophilus TaxID=2259333 RepID=A0A365UBC6_9RHOB|nr:RDD family protein [Rhodosalinus halophilus]RBI86541.1 RDD family protein [Rhodosalinus halophilus]